jgi:hypothetical protein
MNAVITLILEHMGPAGRADLLRQVLKTSRRAVVFRMNARAYFAPGAHIRDCLRQWCARDIEASR